MSRFTKLSRCGSLAKRRERSFAASQFFKVVTLSSIAEEPQIITGMEDADVWMLERCWRWSSLWEEWGQVQCWAEHTIYQFGGRCFSTRRWRGSEIPGTVAPSVWAKTYPFGRKCEVVKRLINLYHKPDGIYECKFYRNSDPSTPELGDNCVPPMVMREHVADCWGRWNTVIHANV